MASTKGRVLNLLGSWVLSEAEVLSVEPVGDRFVHLDVQGPDAAPYAPGTKIQIVLPSRDVRTYTPIGWNSGRFQLLAFRHAGQTPAMRWLDTVRAGERLRFVGPQRSLSLPEGPITFIGDETAIAVAAAYRKARADFKVLFEVEDGLEVQPTLNRVGLEDAQVVSRGDRTDPVLLDAVAPGAQVGMAGGGAMVQRVRAALRERGVTAFKVKTYWLQGRAGLD
ncbi:MAG: hypothetical protein AAGA48_41375 [Myxococcota bacterium]